MQINLNGSWYLKCLNHQDSHAFVFDGAFLPEGWLDAPVPGDVRTALRARGLIDGHYLGKKLDQERWIDESDWLYYRLFTLPEKPEGAAVLKLEGVDTLSEVWLNGHLLGRTDNMFMPWEFPVENANWGGENELLIRIRSTVRMLEGIDRTGLYPADDTDRLLLRKSQMNFGWDFCGHCLTHGLWKGVSIDVHAPVELGDVYLRTERIDDSDALVVLDAPITGDGQGCRVRLQLFDNGRECLSSEWDEADEHKHAVLSNARLWWPRPYGESFLYDAKITLLSGSTELDCKTFRFGVRTAELVQEPLPVGGRSFRMRVNGRDLFVRGANWVPVNAVYAEITDEEVQFFLQRAVDANLSMLRIWGGGIYESDAFFDFCDEHGIMIMQDFMLACGVLPQDDAFVDHVTRETAWAVRHYRNRASIVLWSADNELDEAYRWYDILPQFPTNRVNRIGVRRGVEAEDPYRPFLVSSPCSPFVDEPGADDPNDPTQGDMHVYLTRFSSDSPYYYKKLLEFVPRFMSEYGFSSLPSRDSYEKFNFYQHDLDMQANPWLGELAAFQKMADEKNVEDMIYFTQYSHARALKYWIEYLRSYKGVCGGSLYWKFNDPIAPNRENMLFPSLMSSIDFFGMPKLAYDYTRRAYEDVILAFREEEGVLKVFGCNETDKRFAGQLTLQWTDADGCQTLGSFDCAIEPDQAVLLHSMDPSAWAQRRDGYLKAVFDGSIHLENRFFFGDIADYIGVRPPEAQLTCSVQHCDENAVEIRIRTDRFVQDVCLCILNRNAVYSDNAFDMDAGECRLVRITLPQAQRCGKRLKISACNAKAVCLSLSPSVHQP